MKNISNIHDCYGCGVCATVCPQNIIMISLNEDGFYEPYIDNLDKCTDCGLCRSVCSFCNEGLSLNKHQVVSYGAWSKDNAVRHKCSSGGVGFELGRYLIGQGYKICGVRYNADNNIAEHYIAANVDELISSIGSKYIQSYTVDGFKAIDCKQKYLVTGTPCQIDSFRRYIQMFHKENNFVLMDFFCHGVPSMFVWHKYTAEVVKKVGKIIDVSWRNKQTVWHDKCAKEIGGEEFCEKVNWHDSYNLLIKGNKSFLQSRLSKGDDFYKLFLGDQCLGKACYENCKFRYDNSSADIRIGDAWGKTYNDNEDGVSASIAFTEKGKKLLQECNLELKVQPLNVIAEGQIKTSPKRYRVYDIIMASLKDKNLKIESVIEIQKHFDRRKININRIKHPLLTLINIVKKYAN